MTTNKMKLWKLTGGALFLCAAYMFPFSAWAEETLKPYVLAGTASGDVASVAAEITTKLKGAGFEIAGEYSPYPGAHVIAVTSAELKEHAAQSELGGYGAAQRVSVTQVGDQVQVAYTNPEYMANAYRMEGNLKSVARKLAAALGEEQAFGSEKGLTAKKLRKYRYMMMMPRFDDQLELADHGAYDTAVAAVTAGLEAGRGGTMLVYRVDVPGKDETLFGVAIEQGEGADETVMATVDTSELKHTAHLPYEMLVSGGKVYALHGQFRIAVSFPDLGMGTFMKISKAPDAIAASLGEAAGGTGS